ncbi:MAG: hypothetical protein IKK28_01930 [Mogibacterium sp.]|nr:hypothetical protein [Mogibacterium sp.]
MKNIDFSNRFHIFSPELLQNTLAFGSSPYVPEGADEAAALRPIVFSQEPQDDDDGTFWKMNFSASVADRSLMKYNKTRAYIVFHMNDGSIRLLGTPQEAPLITITPHAGALSISATFESAEPVTL